MSIEVAYSILLIVLGAPSAALLGSSLGYLLLVKGAPQ